jgi:hypothetical protein
VAPYRLDLSASVLRRLATNVVDVLKRNVGLVTGATRLDLDRVVDALRPQQGMLYYHLLLARLEARGELGRGSIPDGDPTRDGSAASVAPVPRRDALDS